MGSSSILSPPFKQGGDVTTTTVQSPSTSSPITSKQLLQLLDTIRTLGDENASLLHEVDMARKAQLEAKATREAMKVFQEEYAKRFSTLKSALEQYQKEHPIHIHHPIHSSSYVAAEAELRKKDEMIEKLTVELSQEKEESRKKDSALRKYENFYKEVKARSAQKAKERQEEKNKQV
jgi:DNA repair exonuclease SbcCD ATPase subunit